MTKQAHSLLAIHDNTWTLKFENFSEFQNVIIDKPMLPTTRERHYDALRTKIDMWLTQRSKTK